MSGDHGCQAIYGARIPNGVNHRCDQVDGHPGLHTDFVANLTWGRCSDARPAPPPADDHRTVAALAIAGMLADADEGGRWYDIEDLRAVHAVLEGGRPPAQWAKYLDQHGHRVTVETGALSPATADPVPAAAEDVCDRAEVAVAALARAYRQATEQPAAITAAVNDLGRRAQAADRLTMLAHEIGDDSAGVTNELKQIAANLLAPTTLEGPDHA